MNNSGVKSGMLTKFSATHLHTHTDEDGRKRKTYLFVVRGSEILDEQKYFAEICADAKYVSYIHKYSSHSLTSGSYAVYEVTATYTSFDEDIYGDQNDDYND
jgi:hypothetical protein